MGLDTLLDNNDNSSKYMCCIWQATAPNNPQIRLNATRSNCPIHVLLLLPHVSCFCVTGNFLSNVPNDPQNELKCHKVKGPLICITVLSLWVLNFILFRSTDSRFFFQRIYVLEEPTFCSTASPSWVSDPQMTLKGTPYVSYNYSWDA